MLVSHFPFNAENKNWLHFVSCQQTIRLLSYLAKIHVHAKIDFYFAGTIFRKLTFRTAWRKDYEFVLRFIVGALPFLYI